MLVDGNIGGSVDGTAGADLAALEAQIALADRVGYSGVWSTEVGRDPFLPLVVAARASASLTIGTAVTVAFARSPMTVATAAYDLQGFSRGRFVLGLGSQVKAHVTRRFGMPWSAPAERMAEFIAAVRAIWTCWQDETELDFRGEFYSHTLMTPMFRPEPLSWSPPPVLLAAVGPQMTRVAGRSADGLIAHSFTTARYLREETLPLVDAGLVETGRRREDFTVSLPGLVATGADEHELATAIQAVRAQVAFYAATPAYRSVLSLHGLDDLHEELHRLSRQGQWSAMASLVDDGVLAEFAVVGTAEEAGAEVRRRYEGLVDRFTLAAPYPMSEEVRRDLTAVIQKG